MKSDSDAAVMYLELLKMALTRYHLEDKSDVYRIGLFGRNSFASRVGDSINRLLRPTGVALARYHLHSLEERRDGLDWPVNAETMIGLRRLDQLHEALQVVRTEGVPGSIMETGVWRGGAMIFVAGFLKAYAFDRKVILADSFRGLPPPDPSIAGDAGDLHHTYSYLAVSREEVEGNFRKFGLFGNHLQFIEGFFEDTLPPSEPCPLSILRLDGDMYSSTYHVLQSMYDQVSPGGFVIIDDYGLRGARNAVDDFLNTHNLTVSLQAIQPTGVYWRVPR